MKTMPARKTINTRKQPDMSKFTITHHVLLIQFSNRVVITIDEIAELYLGIPPNTAKNKARTGDLPFPVFKMGESAKSPYVVHIDDLARYINERCLEAERLWKCYKKLRLT